MAYITDAARVQAQERYDEIISSFKNMIDAFHKKYGEELYSLFGKVEEPDLDRNDMLSVLTEAYLEFVDNKKGK